MFLTSRDIIIAIRQLYSISEIVTKLLVQLMINAGWSVKNDDEALRQQLTSIASTVFELTISILTGYRQCQTNSRAARVICFQIFNKKYFITINLNQVQFLNKFQIATLESKGIAI